MEAFGGNSLEEEWESLGGLFTCEDSNDPFLLHDSFPNYADSFVVSEGVANVATGFLDINSNCNISQESSNSTESDQAVSCFLKNHVDFHDDNVMNKTFVESMSFCNDKDSFVMPVFPEGMMEDLLQFKSGTMIICSDDQLGNAGEIQAKRKCEVETPTSQDNYLSDQSTKKRPRIPRDAQKRKGNSRSKKDKKPVIHPSNDEDENISNGGGNGTAQSPSTCSFDDDFNGGSTSESKGSLTSNSNGKAKTHRGPATDPQSLYARRRRERINERLRILQTLVPNGTKVDISTMLEEAAHYVKFLQLQIKLLSSDDMWMYAPIAYNGMDIGLYQKIVPNLQC